MGDVTSYPEEAGQATSAVVDEALATIGLFANTDLIGIEAGEYIRSDGTRTKAIYTYGSREWRYRPGRHG